MWKKVKRKEKSNKKRKENINKKKIREQGEAITIKAYTDVTYADIIKEMKKKY